MEPTPRESDYYSCYARAQRTCAKCRPCTYFSPLKNDNSRLVFVKGPYPLDTNEKFDKALTPCFIYWLKMKIAGDELFGVYPRHCRLIPDLPALKNTPVGHRQKLIAEKKDHLPAGFVEFENIFDRLLPTTQLPAKGMWHAITTIDWDRLKQDGIFAHGHAIGNQQFQSDHPTALEQLTLNVIFRWAVGCGDFAGRNFVFYNERLYAVDEDCIGKEISLGRSIRDGTEGVNKVIEFIRLHIEKHWTDKIQPVVTKWYERACDPNSPQWTDHPFFAETLKNFILPRLKLLASGDAGRDALIASCLDGRKRKRMDAPLEVEEEEEELELKKPPAKRVSLLRSACTQHGHKPDEAKSGFQKGIRRATSDPNVENNPGLAMALHSFFELYNLRAKHPDVPTSLGLQTNIINRLGIAAAEDCGIGNIYLVIKIIKYVMAIGPPSGRAMRNPMRLAAAIRELAISPKSRIGSHHWGAYSKEPAAGGNYEESVRQYIHDRNAKMLYPFVAMAHDKKGELLWPILCDIGPADIMSCLKMAYEHFTENDAFLRLAVSVALYPECLDHSKPDADFVAWEYGKELAAGHYEMPREYPDYVYDLHTQRGRSMDSAEKKKKGSEAIVGARRFALEGATVTLRSPIQDAEAEALYIKNKQ